MSRKDIEQGFIDAGWTVLDPFSRYPLVGNSGDLSIVAHEPLAETDGPIFELVDRRRVVAYWMTTIPTPRQAAALLEKHGGPPEEHWGKPREP